jgi:hypothetical protein
MRHAFARTSAAMRKCFGSKSGRFISGVSRIAALAGRRPNAVRALSLEGRFNAV